MSYELEVMSYDAQRESKHNSSLITHNLTIHNFNIMPNPSAGVFVLSFSEALTQDGQVSIHDALGRQVWQQKVTAQTRQLPVDLSGADFADGMYWVVLRTEAGTMSKKLILSKL